jgi:hypothetical protein
VNSIEAKDRQRREIAETQIPRSHGIHLPIPQAHTEMATPVAITAARIAAGGIIVPSIAMLVKVAKMPPAGVKAPYMYD